MTTKNNGCWEVVNSYLLKSLSNLKILVIISFEVYLQETIGSDLAKFEDWESKGLKVCYELPLHNSRYDVYERYPKTHKS